MSTPRTAGKGVGTGRWLKAIEFAETASLHFDDATETSESPDSYVTLAVHSGVAASSKDVQTAARAHKRLLEIAQALR